MTLQKTIQKNKRKQKNADSNVNAYKWDKFIYGGKTTKPDQTRAAET